MITILPVAMLVVSLFLRTFPDACGPVFRRLKGLGRQGATSPVFIHLNLQQFGENAKIPGKFPHRQEDLTPKPARIYTP
jgi:hypothetical protein